MYNDDSVFHTGIDSEPGVYDTEDEATEKILQEQEAQIRDLTPKINNIVKMIDAEIKQVDSIDRFITAAKDHEAQIRAEIQASALYKQYLGNFKVMLISVLEEVKNGKRRKKA